MTPARFRCLVLTLPNTIEGSHSGHADFRVDKMIFATLGSPDFRFAMLRLRPDQQATLIELYPAAFAPSLGIAGRAGNTVIMLDRVNEQALTAAVRLAWTSVFR